MTLDAEAMSNLSTRELRATARRIYTHGPRLIRTLQHWRPSICPFPALLEQVPRGASVLDVGCGGGLLLAFIGATRSPARLVGFDSSEAAIGLALENIERFPSPRPEFHRLDAEAAWPSGAFDVVSLCDVLHHVPRSAQDVVLRRCAGALAPGGRLIYKDVHPDGLIRPNASRLHDLVIARERISIPRIADVEGVLRSEGLKSVLQRRINVLWYGHELAVFEKPAHSA